MVFPFKLRNYHEAESDFEMIEHYQIMIDNVKSKK